MTKTRFSVLRRINGDLPAMPVPKFAQDVIDIIIDLFRDEVFEKFPRSENPDVEEHRYWERLDFYKKKVMAAFLREYHTDELDRLLRGRTVTTGTAAIFFHQYVAAIKRSAYNAHVEVDCPLSVEIGEIQDAFYKKSSHAYVI